MSLGTALLLLAAFWCILHLVHHFLSHSSSSSSLLPTTTTHGSNTTTIFRFGSSSSSHYLSHPKPPSKSHSKTTLTLTFFHLRLSTTRFNAPHDRLASFLSRRANRSRRISAFVRLVYDLGAFLGALGMLGACVGLVWGTWGAWGRFVGPARLVVDGGLEAEDGGGGVGLTKRSLEEPLSPPAPVTPSPASWAQITPIIPGVTVPLSHLPLILLAVFLAQAFHELGHALAAALESLPLLSAGASLTLFLPSAFVSFPSSSSLSSTSTSTSTSPSTLPAPSRARLIAAGPFHNILLWAFLLLLTRSGLLPLLAGALSGYRDVSAVGRVVVSVSETSPLYLHLPPGTIITALDDTPLSQPPGSSSEDEWTRYLLARPHIRPTLGWCVPRHVLAKSDECCKPPHSPSNKTASPYACFVSSDRLEQGCIDPIPILTSPLSRTKAHNRNRNRCSSTTDCPPESACVAPSASSQLMRVSVRPPGWVGSSRGVGAEEKEEESGGGGGDTEEGEDAEEGEKEEEGRGREWGRDNVNVVLWSGPREEVWEEVQVTTWFPRAWFLPLWVPPLVQLFWDYLLTATLSLYFFNLLPLPHLDGTQLLRAFLDIVLDPKSKGQPFMYDLESLESGVGVGVGAGAGRREWERDRDGYEYEGSRTRRRKRWKERVVRFVNYGTGGVVACFVVLSVMNGFG